MNKNTARQENENTSLACSKIGTATTPVPEPAGSTRPTIPDLQSYPDWELDEAMRELDALNRADEAAKRGLETLRRCGSLRAFCKAFAMAGTLMATLAFGGAAGADDAPAKPKKPTMCLSGQPVEAKGGFRGFLCTDGKRPRILVRYTVVRFVDESGSDATYVLGWPTAAKSKPAVVPVGGIKL